MQAGAHPAGGQPPRARDARRMVPGARWPTRGRGQIHAYMVHSIYGAHDFFQIGAGVPCAAAAPGYGGEKAGDRGISVFIRRGRRRALALPSTLNV